MFWYCFREREADPRPVRAGRAGSACTRGTSRPAGSPRTSRSASTTSAASSATSMPERIDEYEAILDGQQIFLERTKGIGLLSAEDAIALGQSGPVLRASGVDWDLRKRRALPRVRPRSTSTCPSADNGDVYDRYRVRMRRDARVGADRPASASTAMPDGPWIADDRKVVLPPRHELHTSMESLIHHFKLVTEGFRVPEGEVYVTIESPRGRARLLPRLGRRAEALARALPRPLLRRARGDGDRVARHADRRPDRDRRLARRRHGRGRPVSATALFDEIQEVAARYPVQALGRHAGAPSRAGALRLAARRRRIREVADALDLTPAYVRRSRASTTCTTSSRVGRARDRGLHERLVRARRRAGRGRGLRARARRARRRDDRGRRVLAHAPSNASAGAAGRPSSRWTGATAST